MDANISSTSSSSARDVDLPLIEFMNIDDFSGSVGNDSLYRDADYELYYAHDDASVESRIQRLIQERKNAVRNRSDFSRVHSCIFVYSENDGAPNTKNILFIMEDINSSLRWVERKVFLSVLPCDSLLTESNDSFENRLILLIGSLKSILLPYISTKFSIAALAFWIIHARQLHPQFGLLGCSISLPGIGAPSGINVIAQPGSFKEIVKKLCKLVLKEDEGFDFVISSPTEEKYFSTVVRGGNYNGLSYEWRLYGDHITLLSPFSISRPSPTARGVIAQGFGKCHSWEKVLVTNDVQRSFIGDVIKCRNLFFNIFIYPFDSESFDPTTKITRMLFDSSIRARNMNVGMAQGLFKFSGADGDKCIFVGELQTLTSKLIDLFMNAGLVSHAQQLLCSVVCDVMVARGMLIDKGRLRCFVFLYTRCDDLNVSGVVEMIKQYLQILTQFICRNETLRIEDPSLLSSKVAMDKADLSNQEPGTNSHSLAFDSAVFGFVHNSDHYYWYVNQNMCVLLDSSEKALLDNGDRPAIHSVVTQHRQFITATGRLKSSFTRCSNTSLCNVRGLLCRLDSVLDRSVL